MLRNILLTGLVIWLGLMGVVCGCLFLLCLLLLIFWQGLGISTVVLGVSCIALVVLALMLTTGTGGSRLAVGRKRCSLREWIRQKLYGVPLVHAEEIGEWPADETGYDEWVRRASEHQRSS